jgi:hypothetical protein
MHIGTQVTKDHQKMFMLIFVNMKVSVKELYISRHCEPSIHVGLLPESSALELRLVTSGEIFILLSFIMATHLV